MQMARKYSVSEIDALRQAVENQYLWGRYQGPVLSHGGGASYGMSRSYMETDKATVVEDRVRTFMLAGLTAQDLYAQERDREIQLERGRQERADQSLAQANVTAVFGIARG